MLLISLSALSLACPTVVTGTPAQLSFDTARVAIARQGGRTVFSVSINPVGDPQEFALVQPVPEILAEEDIATLDPEIFARLDGYTAPRRVDDAGCVAYDGAGSDGGSGGSGGGGYGGVEIEAEYIVGEYQVVILSAAESTGLEAWLDDHGYYLPDGAEPILAEYIEGGSYFLAARVSGDAAVASGDALSPLQIRYESEIFSIPIRLATLNSPGEQDMVIYALTDMDPGSDDSRRVGIANYPEVDVEETCIWGDPTVDDFSAFYEGQLAAAWEALGDAGWTVEYAGTWSDCNPCTSIAITAEDVAALGFEESPDASHHLTRIRMRYTPEQADQDLILYGSGIYEPEVTSYADDNSQNRECVDLCNGVVGDEGGGGGGSTDGGGGGGGSTDGGSTDGGSTDGGSTDGGSTDGGTIDGDTAGGAGDTASGDGGEKGGCGCGAAPSPAGVPWALLGLLGLAARRREARRLR